MESVLSSSNIDAATLQYLQCCVAAFLTITFLQSGLDKVFNYQGNREYFRGQFKDSFLQPMVPALFPTILILEMCTGLLSLVGFFFILGGDSSLALAGAQLGMITLLCLFFGQRMAKDYGGASGVVPYLIMNFIGILVF